MSKNTKENFNKAVFDMFGVGGAPEAAAEKAPATSAQADQPQKSEVIQTSAGSEQLATGVERVDVPHAAPYVLVPSTYLAAGTVMEGTLKSKGDVEIAGTFTGEIVSDGDVTVRTKLSGNITASNLTIIDCELEGDCHVTGKMQISEKSHITGNFFAGEMICSGNIIGDTVATSSVTLAPTAKVTGDITTGTLTIERGAFIDGKLSMNK